MSEEKDKHLELDDLKDVSGGYSIEVLQYYGRIGKGNAHTIEYRPDFTERLMGGVSRESVAAYAAEQFGEKSKAFLDAMNSYLQSKLDKNPRYFQGTQTISLSEVSQFLKK